MFRPFQHLTKDALYQMYLDNESSRCIPVSDHYTYPNADENEVFDNWVFEKDAIQEEMAIRWRIAYILQPTLVDTMA